jgi:hypothetical protein
MPENLINNSPTIMFAALLENLLSALRFIKHYFVINKHNVCWLIKIAKIVAIKFP